MTFFWIFIFVAVLFLALIAFLAIRSLFKNGRNKKFDIPDVDIPDISDMHGH